MRGPRILALLSVLLPMLVGAGVYALVDTLADGGLRSGDGPPGGTAPLSDDDRGALGS